MLCPGDRDHKMIFQQQLNKKKFHTYKALLTEIFTEVELSIVEDEDAKVQDIKQEYSNHELIISFHFLQRSSCLKTEALPLQSL